VGELAPFVVAALAPADAVELAPRADEAPGFEWSLGTVACAVVAGYIAKAAELAAAAAAAGEPQLALDDLRFRVAAFRCRAHQIALMQPGAPDEHKHRAAFTVLGARLVALRPAEADGYWLQARGFFEGDARAGPLLRCAVAVADAARDCFRLPRALPARDRRRRRRRRAGLRSGRARAPRRRG
jgi:hypothetical protein